MAMTIAGTVNGTAVAGTIGITPAGIIDAGIQNAVWISIRTDGDPGSGTQDDPFDGSTQAKFDALMRSFSSGNIRINLLTGTYSTFGVWDNSGTTNGFLTKPGWKIYGSGMGQTIVKLTGQTSVGTTFNHAVFAANGADCSGLEIHDLTIDCNSLNIGLPLATDSTGGIEVGGNNIWIDNVEIINAYGIFPGGHESFCILVTSGNNLKVTNCYTHSYAAGANYTNGVTLGVSGFGGVVACNYDDGGAHGFSGGGSNDLFLANTTTSNTGVGWYVDTGSVDGLTLKGNTFAAATIPIQFNVDSPSTVKNVQIEGNILLAYDASGTSGIVLGGNAPKSNFIISNNIMKNPGGGPGTGFILNNGAGATGLVVNGNITDGSAVGAGGLGTDIFNSNNQIGTNFFGGSPTGVTADGTTLSFYNGSGGGAQSISLNLARANTWTAQQTFSTAPFLDATSGPALSITGASGSHSTDFFANTDGSYSFRDNTTLVGAIAWHGGTSGTAGQYFKLPANSTFGWCANANNNGASDTSISRSAAGVINVGNGTQGDKSGTINAKSLTLTGALTEASQSLSASGNLAQGCNFLTGTTGTGTMPAPAGTAGQPLMIKNNASGSWTIASASGSQIIATGATTATASITLMSGSSARFISDGSSWNQI